MRNYKSGKKEIRHGVGRSLLISFPLPFSSLEIKWKLNTSCPLSPQCTCACVHVYVYVHITPTIMKIYLPFSFSVMGSPTGKLFVYQHRVLHRGISMRARLLLTLCVRRGHLHTLDTCPTHTYTHSSPLRCSLAPFSTRSSRCPPRPPRQVRDHHQDVISQPGDAQRPLVNIVSAARRCRPAAPPSCLANPAIRDSVLCLSDWESLYWQYRGGRLGMILFLCCSVSPNGRIEKKG